VTASSPSDRFAPYVPRLLAEWDLDAPDTLWRTIDSTCCFVDISGFTALSERLARRGRIGAEELTEILNHVFSRMLAVAYEKGGSLLKFGGDALLLVFTRGEHAVLGAEAAVAMRAALREARTLATSVGRINLRMSVGLHSGDLLIFRVGDVHHELIVSGPVATITTEMEHAADAGEILISQEMASLLPKSFVGEAKDPGVLLRGRRVVEGGPGPEPMRSVPDDAAAASVPRLLHRRLTDPTAESEHRVATVGFVKYVGVDHLLAERGPGGAANAIDAVVRAVQAEADAEGVTFLASDIDANGGKLILATGVPYAQEDDEGRMLRAATAIVGHKYELAVRVGVNTGHVFAADIGTGFRRTFTIMGDTVNLAARLMAAASSGQVLATSAVLDRASTLFQTESLPPFMVKGKSQPVQAYTVGPATGLRSSSYATLPFRGREPELRRLHDLYADGEAGRTAVIEGQRGSGKSRLVTEFLAALPSVPTFVAQGEPNGSGVPYLPLRAPARAALGIDARDRSAAGAQLVERVKALAPDLIPLLPLLAPVVDADLPPTPESAAVATEFVRDQVGELLVTLFEAAFANGIVILFEDAHWFDESSSEICARVADAATTRPWLICATRRPDPGGYDMSTDVVIQLEPLSKEAALSLVEDATSGSPLRPQECDGIVSRADGNPLFIEELLRIVRATDVEALPESLDAIAMREIDSLPVLARRVLRLGSVLGRSFEAALLHALLEDEPAEVAADPLLGLEALLTDSGNGTLMFRHAVLQEAAYQSLPFRSRLALHLRAGQAIERTAVDTKEVATILSYHFIEAKDWERAWHYAPLAARAAQAAYAPSEATVHLERALMAANKLGTVEPHVVGTLLAELGETLIDAGLYDRAEAAFRRAAATARDDPLERARLAERLGEVLGEFQGRSTAAIRQLRSGRALIDALDASDTAAMRIRAQLLAREASTRAQQGRLTDAARLAESASALAEAIGEERTLAMSLGVFDTCVVQLGQAERATHMHRVLEIYEQLGDQMRVAITLGNLGGVSYFESKWDEATAYFVRAADAATAAGYLAGAALDRVNLGEIYVTQGRLAEAVQLLPAALRTLESFGFLTQASGAMLHLGRAQALSGDLEGGIALIQAAAATFEKAGIQMGLLESRTRLAEIYVFAGRAHEAAGALAAARLLDQAIGETVISAMIDRVEVTLSAIETPEGARDLLVPAMDRARTLGASFDLLVLLTLADRLDQGRWAEWAEDLARELGVVNLTVLPEQLVTIVPA
jgi:class 3 adenylate cyclase/tetratricopeptide (TPR) repeat protein